MAQTTGAARVYSYIRFSDAKQAAGASSERQGAYAERWAAEHGVQLDTELSMRDEGLSAYHQRHVRHGALGVFLLAIEEGKVARDSVLIVEGLDRLSRAEPIQAQAQLASIINAGIAVVTASDGKIYSRDRLKDNPMDLVYSLLVMIRAHEESDTKSKRVRDAVRRQCLAWKAGTYRGPIRSGNWPAWLEHIDGAWRLMPTRIEAVRLAVQMALQGSGLGRIARELHERGLAYSESMPSSGGVKRLLEQPALIGEKHLAIDGEVHVLEGYFPAVVERPTFDFLQEKLRLRSRKMVKGDIPSILTGTGITTCGYCGSRLKAQTMANKRRPDGTLADSHRRLQCIKVNDGDGCAVPGSCSAAPIERALIHFCSDMVNLQGLYADDHSALPRAELAGAQAALDQIDQQLQRLTEALLASDAPPATFTRRAHELEAARSATKARVQAAERDMAAATRADLSGADTRWRAVAEGVAALDYTARMQARQLVADTFERIVVWMQGLRPAEAPPGTIDVLLHAKGGTTRMLRIDKAGGWIAGEDINP